MNRRPTLTRHSHYPEPFYIAASNASAESRAKAWITCDGIDDEKQIQTVIDALPSIGTKIGFSEGTFTCGAKILYDSLNNFEGQGVESTIITLADSVDDDVFQSRNFSTLTGTDSSGGEHRVRFANLTIDGNKANQASGRGIRKYGYHHIFGNIVVRNCKNEGVWSEWGTSAGNPSGGDSMEDQWINVKVHSNDGVGIEWRGPHDSMFTNVLSFLNGSSGMVFRDAATYDGGSCQLTNCHLWGNLTTGVSLDIQGVNLFASNVQVEGSSGAGGIGIRVGTGSSLRGSNLTCFANETDIELLANDSFIHGFFSGDTGIKMGNASTSVSGVMITGKFLSNATQCIEWLHASNSSNFFIMQAFVASGDNVITQTAAVDQTNNKFVIEQGGAGTLARFENSGTATINSGATSVTVTHGLAVTPTLDDISVVLGENPTNDPGNIWVDTITSTQFNINCRNDPGASNLDLAWRAIVI